MKNAVLSCLVLTGLLVLAGAARAQEVDAFLACADITDRAERLACLDDALNDATRDRTPPAPSERQAPATAVEDFGETSGGIAETGEQEAEAEKEPFFRLPRIGIFRRGQDGTEQAGSDDDTIESDGTEEDRLESFGRGPRVVINENGEDELNDVITELFMAKPNMWLVRLGSGQVWRQVHPKRLNLREGDSVRIYPTGWGDNYRLETSRLSGYIQVLRVE